ncbi:hypothetical protein AQI95_15680 [Streptomyces yokosukanensis]|uniref:Uncharacterized protein n=1 Tax=Streptomyces yokosukanensis TaxID=67386 RepID=A0A101P5M9_9ACTN|nr:hypothetical protein [Streptomyces yokosukanensis]KUN05378.1 hypothetical protein AQI95_15680 [Streptomyces yokosukanensis]
MTSSRTRAETPERVRRTRSAHGPWAAVRAAATVVLGPAEAVASALDQANAAPLRHTARSGRAQARLPAGATRRRTAG